MKNSFCSKHLSYRVKAFALGRQTVRFKKTTVAALTSITIVIALTSALQAQSKPVSVSGVTSQSSSNGTTFSIAADGSLSNAQTWQDGEGYHVVVPNAVSQSSIQTAQGVKLRRVGTSVEIVIPTKSSDYVTVLRLDNRMNLIISANTGGSEGTGRQDSVQAAPMSSDSTTSSSQSLGTSYASTGSSSQGPYQPNVPSSRSSGQSLLVSSQNSATSPGSAGDEPEILVQPEDDGLFASIFSSTSLLIVMALAIFAFLVYRKVRSRQSSLNGKGKAKDQWVEESIQTPLPSNQSALVGSSGRPPNSDLQKGRRSETTAAVATPTSLYGAYRIDQEVGKLVLGQPHRMDVLSSRAPDDRRAIEASLVKMIVSTPDEVERRRALEALEEYGFVARQCAALLLAPDAFDRTSAARSLGEVKCTNALPFLLEALYDQETIVRNQAVVSIGELKLPRAIGALLDMARQHPDVPAGLVSRALSACSVEGLDFFDTTIAQPGLLGDGRDFFSHDITHLEPASLVEDLPDVVDNAELNAAFVMVADEDPTKRSEAAKELAQFHVIGSVNALSDLARLDPAPAVRAQAIASLAVINHESVFPAVLICLADESREVRAAAARALSRLNFDRTDAYVRLIETADEQLLQEVAHACIKAGIVSQGLDRLATGDRRQSYEAFSIISLLAKAKRIDTIMDAISSHMNLDVRLAAVRLLANIRDAGIVEHLRKLTVQEGVPEEVKTALLEALYKLERETSDGEKPPEFPLVQDPDADLSSDTKLETNNEIESHSKFEGQPDELKF